MVDNAEMEEERRLAYVGITRAKEKVFLLHARQRLIFGSLESNLPSRFFEDIPDSLVEKQVSKQPQMKRDRFFEIKPKSVLTEDADMEKFVDGDKVRHKDFGEGVVVGQDNIIIHVVFSGLGLKKLAKSIAPLERVSE